MHARKAPGSCATQEPQKDGLRLVVAGVADCHGISRKMCARSIKELMAGASGRMLD